jgi:hypothetical protein
MVSILRIGKYDLRAWRGEWATYSPQGVGLPIYSASCIFEARGAIGRIDQKLFAALGRAESLRLIADYTGTPLAAKTAAETVVRAEAFVSAVEKVLALNESSITNDLENDGPDPQNKVSEPRLAAEQSETDYARLTPVSLEEIRRQARENWLQLRQKVGVEKDVDHSKDPDRGAKEDQSHSIDDDLGQ